MLFNLTNFGCDDGELIGLLLGETEDDTIDLDNFKTLTCSIKIQLNHHTRGYSLTKT